MKTLTSKQSFEKALIVLVISAIILRLFLSTINPYFDRDEVRKLLRTSGYTDQQFIEQTYIQKPIPNREFLEKYQVPCVNCTPKPTLSALTNNKEHPPLYYALLQAWLLTLGQFWNAKLFSSLISIATIPAIYWLTLEFFRDRQAGMISAALFAFSPYFFSVGQHVSQYTLWGLLTCLSTAAFLRVFSSEKKKPWLILYIFFNILGLYTHLFYVLLMFSHGLYLLCIKAWKGFKLYLIAAIISSISFLPWAISLILNYDRFEDTAGIGGAENVGSSSNIIVRFLKASTFIITLFWRKSNISILNNDFIDNNGTLALSILLLIGFTFLMFQHARKQREGILILTILYGHLLPLVAVSEVIGHGFAEKVRYYLPSAIVVLVGVSFWVSMLLRSSPASNQSRNKYLGLALITVLLVSSIAATGNLSLKVATQDSNGRQLGPGYKQAASAINQVQKPLVFSSEEYVKVLMFNHWLKPEADVLLAPNLNELVKTIEQQASRLQGNYDRLFIFYPSEDLSDRLTQVGLKFQTVPKSWRQAVVYQVTAE